MEKSKSVMAKKRKMVISILNQRGISFEENLSDLQSRRVLT